MAIASLTCINVFMQAGRFRNTDFRFPRRRQHTRPCAVTDDPRPGNYLFGPLLTDTGPTAKAHLPDRSSV
ncbi:hypothetical protein EVAR_44662_1 [Eumeta japonica]|uniref:Uncharacterized protein n=1 Tax=Eumeta variegata TaxID=151549 RepID=A0A4C1XID4_EUMVA|nr:hypothetical protein EVAR_44662_1 [Eumeta japonica]